MNRLYYGDNLDVLREHVADASVDLVYLDPPFNSNAGYNVLFKGANGAGADASIEAFDDTWTWGPSSQAAMLDIARGANRPLQVMMEAMRTALGDTPLMAYLAMMAVRLIELHRVPRDTGSLYLHCDPTASHYLKLVLDAVFGAKCFSAEIIWRRTTARTAHNRFPRLHDTILHFVKDPEQVVFHPQKLPLDENWVASAYKREDQNGRYTLDNLTAAGTRKGPSGMAWKGHDPAKVGIGRHWRYHPDTLDKLDAEGRIHWPKSGSFPQIKQYLTADSGTSIGDLWTDEAVKLLGRSSAERLGYPT